MYTNNSNIFSRRRGDSMLTNTMKEDLTQGVVDLFRIVFWQSYCTDLSPEMIIRMRVILIL